MAGTVAIACKAPNGVVLNLHTYEPVGSKEQGNVRLVRGKEVTLLGWAHKWGHPDLTADTGGYRLTEIDADFWAEWVKRNPDSPLLADKIILPPPDKAGMAASQARDHRAVPKMFAPVTENDERMPKGVSVADEMKGRAAA